MLNPETRGQDKSEWRGAASSAAEPAFDSEAFRRLLAGILRLLGFQGLGFRV